MKVNVFQADALPALQPRLDECDIPRRLVLESDIADLNQSNSEEVLIIPRPVLNASSWPGLRVRLAQANRRFIVAGEDLHTRDVMTAARDGACDVLDLADNRERWRSACEQAAQSQSLWLTLYGPTRNIPLEGMIGESSPMKSLRQAIERMGVTDVNVLIIGESGAGKERIAEALHTTGSKGPLIAVNCAAIPKDLMEAELFGAEKGAFTGAVKSRSGLVEQADGGTLFLDEIGEMDISLQPKLLRFLETKQARRVGGEKDYTVTLRVVSATNRNIEQAINNGAFRADLYYRLSEVTLNAPPLRNRREDIPLLVRAFIDLGNERFGKNIEGAEPELIRKLQAWHWPGNVRELKSVVERLVLLYDGPLLRAGYWEPPASANPAALPHVFSGPAAADHGQLPPVNRLPSKRERRELARALLAEGTLSLSETAARVGVHPTTLFRWRKEGKV